MALALDKYKMLIFIAVDAFRGGQQEVDFKDAATGRGVFRLCS